jgi:death-on-curing protein
MMELKDVLNIHDILVERFGGSKGIRDKGSLEAAINRPFATFDSKDLFHHLQTKLLQFLKAS